MKIFCALLMILAAFSPRLLASSQVPEITGLFKDGFQIDRGSASGVKVGSTGKVYYLVSISGKDRRNEIAKFIVTDVEENTCKARITQKTNNPDIGHLVSFAHPLKEPGAGPGGAGGTATPPKTPPPSIELTFWDSIKESQNPDDFRAYLKKFPRGNFVDLANNRIKVLVEEQEAAAAREEEKFGWIEVSAFPFAEVTVDGRALGEVPPLKTEKLAAGEHEVVFTLEGWEPVTKKVLVEADVKLRVFHNFRKK